MAELEKSIDVGGDPQVPAPGAGANSTAPTTPAPTDPDPLNVIILGASFGGLSCAHHFLDYTIDKLRTTTVAPEYRLIIVSPSTNIYWNIGAPRAVVASGLISTQDAFIPIEPGFHRHRGHNFTFLQGSAISMDSSAREVTVKLLSPEAQRRAARIQPTRKTQSTQLRSMLDFPDIQRFSYHALLLCTGTSADSELLSLHGPHTNTLVALDTFRERVANAQTIVICGGGCSGVEAAGQLATYLNFKSHFPIRRRVKNPKHIILIVGGPRCLPQLKESVSAKAEKALTSLGVEIRYNVRVEHAVDYVDDSGATRVDLDDGTSLVADAYLACTGVRPNTGFLPAHLKNERGYISTNPDTMRVEGAGDRVYAIGDVASYSQNYVLDVYAAVPVAMHNMLNDLLKHELYLASPYGGNEDYIAELEDLTYMQTPIESQLCPITRFGGAGMLMNKTLPKIMVFLLKGHDYRVSKAKRVVVDGGNPYAVKTKYE